MSEFGHIGHCAGPGAFIDSWGAGPFLITIGDRTFRFEDSDRFGPILIRADGEPRHNPVPVEGHPFWTAWQAWRDQGRQIQPDRMTCIWEPTAATEGAAP